MTVPADQPLFAFAGHRLLARGPASEVVAAVRTATDAAASRNRRAERILDLFPKGAGAPVSGAAQDKRKDRDTAIADARRNW